jgi:hypothetical protein
VGFTGRLIVGSEEGGGGGRDREELIGGARERMRNVRVSEGTRMMVERSARLEKSAFQNIRM